MFRSQDVNLFRIKTSLESVWEVLNFIGGEEMAMIELPEHREVGFDSDFFQKLKRLEEFKTRLLSVEERASEFNTLGRIRPRDFQELGERIQARFAANPDQVRNILQGYQQEATQKLNSLDDLIGNYENLIERNNELNDAQLICNNVQDLMPSGFNQSEFKDGSQQEGAESSLAYFAGIIDTKDLLRFKRIVFRMSRGKVLFQNKELAYKNEFSDRRTFSEVSNKGAPETKSIIFMICYGSALVPKIKSLIFAYNVFCLNLPSTGNLQQSLQQYSQDLQENWKICQDTYDQVRSLLRYFMQPSEDTNVSKIDELQYLIYKEMVITKATSQMGHTGNIYEFEMWLDAERQGEFLTKMSGLNSADPNFVKPQIEQVSAAGVSSYKAPTLFKTNDFTQPFQDIVETYGIPKFKEINPAFFTVVTFPYEFGVMFGDFGHGLILFMAGLFLCSKADEMKKMGGAFKTLASLRFLFTMMGFFATYNGLVYNDIFSVKIPVLPTCYDYQTSEGQFLETFKRKEGCVYPFGLDWAWALTSNEVTFFNSFKMKLSIIIGVLHMSLGIILKGLNAIYFVNYVDFFFEFVPQISFFVSIFGYMLTLIFAKWAQNWNDACTGKIDDLCPQIISTFTSLTSVKAAILPKELQQSIQFVIMAVAGSCVFLMLFPKPIILYFMQSDAPATDEDHGSYRQTTGGSRSSLISGANDLDLDVGQPLVEKDLTQVVASSGHGHGKEPFGELFIHQLIETIEFVLGSISNTASYLRLWALSLAHAQLSKVFLELILANFYKAPTYGILSGIMMVPGFFFLAMVTLSVLMVMDLMECFLHTLRLHWVEFQNKFFKGEGKKFQEFGFTPLTEGQ